MVNYLDCDNKQIICEEIDIKYIIWGKNLVKSNDVKAKITAHIEKVLNKIY